LIQVRTSNDRLRWEFEQAVSFSYFDGFRLQLQRTKTKVLTQLNTCAIIRSSCVVSCELRSEVLFSCERQKIHPLERDLSWFLDGRRAGLLHFQQVDQVGFDHTALYRLYLDGFESLFVYLGDGYELV
jgi:hypothetical protein